MSDVDDAASEAHDAISTAINQLGQAVFTPLARIDSEARAGYFDLHNGVQTIAKRLAAEVGPQAQDLSATHQAIINNISSYEQARHNSVAAQLDTVVKRVQGRLLRGIKAVGS